MQRIDQLRLDGINGTKTLTISLLEVNPWYPGRLDGIRLVMKYIVFIFR